MGFIFLDTALRALELPNGWVMEIGDGVWLKRQAMRLKMPLDCAQGLPTTSQQLDELADRICGAWWLNA